MAAVGVGAAATTATEHPMVSAWRSQSSMWGMLPTGPGRTLARARPAEGVNPVESFLCEEQPGAGTGGTVLHRRTSPTLGVEVMKPAGWDGELVGGAVGAPARRRDKPYAPICTSGPDRS